MTQLLPRGISLSEGVRSSTLVVDATHDMNGDTLHFRKAGRADGDHEDVCPLPTLPTFAV